MKSIKMNNRFIQGILIAYFICSTQAHLRWIEAKVPLQGEPSKRGTPWPLPHNFISTEQQVYVDAINFKFESKSNCPILEKAVERYIKLTFPCAVSNEIEPSEPALRHLQIIVENDSECGYPHPIMNESYSLIVNVSNQNPYAQLHSQSVWGALRGLESFSQLVYSNRDEILEKSGCTYSVNSTVIFDKPAYSYRGFMLDTARHYISPRTIFAHLDALAYNKFNVFHWHLVDDQSWPFVSQVKPELHTKGAYSPKHIYTRDFIKQVIEYARDRGIRVLPELDTPGHTFQIPKRLLTACYGYRTEQIRLHNWTIEDIMQQPINLSEYGKPYTGVYGVHGEYEILNPTLEETFEYIADLLLEIKDIFPDEFVHLGMDEVYYACWQSNPDIIKFMKEKNFTKVSDVEEYYVSRTLHTARNKMNRKYQIWQDPFDNGVKIDSDAIIQVWKGKTNEDDPADLATPWQEYAQRVTSQDYQMILSSCWYLNIIVYPYPNNDWEKHYKCQPRSFSTKAENKKLVLGGEACMWGEFSDSTVSISRTWPRASAVGERLWTDLTDYDINSVRFRLDDWRCRMLQRGLPVAPILNGYCGDYEWDMS